VRDVRRCVVLIPARWFPRDLKQEAERRAVQQAQRVADEEARKEAEKALHEAMKV
jgi:hypothetical protein